MSDHGADAAALTPKIEVIAEEWMRLAAGASYLPMGKADARAALEHHLYRLLNAMRAPRFDSAVAYRTGEHLVALGLSSPAVVGSTTWLLADRLPSLLDAEQTRVRLPLLLGQITAGLCAAQRTMAVRAAETMNSSEKRKWRREQQQWQERLRQVQLHDPQTQLPNLASLRTELALRAAGSTEGRRMGVCLLSVDRFAELFDALGYDDIGHLLAAAADRLQEVAAHQGHFLAHLGEDLFAITTSTRSFDDLVKAADHARRALKAPIAVDGYRLRLTTTAGLVEGSAAGTDADAWIRDARCALGWARQDRQEQARFDAARAAADRRRQRLAALMPTALDDGQFVPYFQPIYELAGHRIVAVEALARWQHGADLIGPQDFIGLAEQTGLIRQLGRCILTQACAQAVAWRHLGHDLIVSVNVSALQLAEPGLAPTVAGILHEAGLPASSLQLEITESAAVEQHHAVLDALAALGVRIAIDDFGTGYSNLSVLTDLPITCLKLDGAFVRRISTASREAVVLLRHIRQLCKALRIKVIAEGIENAAEEELLRSLGYAYGQGFHRARPATAEAITDLLTQQPGGANS